MGGTAALDRNRRLNLDRRWRWAARPVNSRAANRKGEGYDSTSAEAAALMGPDTPLAVARLSRGRAVVALGQPSPWPAYLTTDGGADWSPARACAPPGYRPLAFTAAGSRLAWARCLGGSAADSSAKPLARSADAGRRWKAVAENGSLAPGTRHPVPADPGDVLAALAIVLEVRRRQLPVRRHQRRPRLVPGPRVSAAGARRLRGHHPGPQAPHAGSECHPP